MITKSRNTYHVTRNKEHGFTLIEAIVATAVFAFVVSSILGVYMSVIRLNGESSSERAILQSGRYVMDFLGKEIINGHIDYSRYPGQVTSATTQDLYIINQAGETEHIYGSGGTLFLEKATGTTILSGYTSGINATKLAFYVSPVGNPYTAAKNYNVQPSVSVILELTKASDGSKLNLQSTFSTLYYPAR